MNVAHNLCTVVN